MAFRIVTNHWNEKFPRFLVIFNDSWNYDAADSSATIFHTFLAADAQLSKAKERLHDLNAHIEEFVSPAGEFGDWYKCNRVPFTQLLEELEEL